MLMSLFEDHTNSTELYYLLFALLLGYPVTGNRLPFSSLFLHSNASIALFLLRSSTIPKTVIRNTSFLAKS